MSEALIEVRGVAVGWGERVLLENLEFEIAEGEIFVILGGSGCGKSTLLRHLIGLERPMRGSIRVRGIGDPADAAGMPRTGVMFQAGALFGSLTLLENVALPLETWTSLPRDAIRAVARSKLALVGLGGFEHHLPAAISGGMKKRAAIARALALEPPLLYLDEPSAGLDPITAVELDELLLALARGLGTTLVVVTHELASIFKIASRCIMLDGASRGIIARGKPLELRESSDPRVHAFFNRQARKG
jgi:phospholipid/cholesterol/gamma-HCH transport system ATP-binding protein